MRNRAMLSLTGPLCAAVALALLWPTPLQAQAASGDSNARLQAIEKAVDARRKELHIPGAALVIVKDDRVIYEHGLGLRDVEHKLPVTPHTLFAIGSSTKAFTAMTAMMSVDDGKLNLSDSPKKYLPYFKLQDPEADSKITLTDLLCHRSGLDRTDLLFYPNVLTSQELIRALATVKPTAKLGEKFQYQNLMFLTAGEIVGKVQGAPWTTVVARRIFQPLGMKSTNTSIKAMQHAGDYALGYTYDEEKKELTHLPMRDISRVAPAGAINSNTTDMAQWVRFMLDGGVVDGKRLVSEHSFQELTVPRITVAGSMKYGYGWFLRDWNGHKVVEHGGNIDGFNAEVALMPDQHLGFVLLTNVSASTLGETAQESVWQNLVGVAAETQAAAISPEKAVGIYHSDELNADMSISAKDGKLLMKRVGSPTDIPLESIGNGRYKAGPPAPEGIVLVFRPTKADPTETEMVLQQSGVEISFKRAKAGDAGKSTGPAEYHGSMQDLIGSYKATNVPITFEVAVRNGKVSLIVPGQPAYPLVEKTQDVYTLGDLPAPFALLIRRDAKGGVAGATLKQPPNQGDLELTRVGSNAPAAAPMSLPSVEAVMQKMIATLGGEANLRRHTSMLMEFTLDRPTQGLTGRGTLYARAPGAKTTELALYAMKKRLMTTRDYFDGEAGGDESSLSAASVKAGKELATARREADFYSELNWKTLYSTVTVSRIEKVGDEEAYVIEAKPLEGDPVTEYVSTKTYLLLKRVTVQNIPNIGALPISESYSDWRTVDGVRIAFKQITTSPVGGDTITTTTRVRFNVPIADSAFQATENPSSN